VAGRTADAVDGNGPKPAVNDLRPAHPIVHCDDYLPESGVSTVCLASNTFFAIPVVE